MDDFEVMVLIFIALVVVILGFAVVGVAFTFYRLIG